MNTVNLQEPGSAGRLPQVKRTGQTSRGITEAQAFAQLDQLKQRMDRLAQQQTQLGRQMGVTAQLTGLGASTGYTGTSFRTVDADRIANNLRESLETIFASTGNPADAKRLAEAGARGRDPMSASTSTDPAEQIFESFKRMGFSESAARAAARGR